MSNRFPLHTIDDAPDDAARTLRAVEAEFGMIPNLERVMAASPHLLAGYAKLWELFGKASLLPEEQQVVYLVANLENGCDYCVAWHTLLGKKAKLPDEELKRLRAGRELANPRWRALQRFTTAMINSRGNPRPADFEEFLEAGYEPRHALEVVLGLAVKTMSNYTNGLAGTPLDEVVEKFRWEPPSLRSTT